MSHLVGDLTNACAQAPAKLHDSVTFQETGPSCGCGGGSGSGSTPFIYAIGRIQTRFPTLSIEREFAQALGQNDTKGLTDSQAIHEMLSRREYRYLARMLCWVMTIENLETYILTPRDPVDIDLLIESLRPGPKPTDVDVVVGVRGPIATRNVCNGLEVPIVVVDQVYSFDVPSLLSRLPRPESIPEDQFGAAAEELFYRIVQVADNAGGTDEHRALNYLSVRYDAIYKSVAEAYGRGETLSGVEVRNSRLTGVRNVKDVIFSFTNRNTDVMTKLFVRVDVTEEFPFLITKLSPYYDR